MGHHPLHGPTCSTGRYDWHCPECGDPVKVFHCTCGSWVMFDSLGGDWPRHDCFNTEYRKLVGVVKPILDGGADPRSATFAPFAALRDRLDPGRLSTGPTGLSEPRAKLFEHRKPAIEHVIKTMTPIEGEAPVFFLGVVRERERNTARIQQVYGAVGEVGVKLLGLPARPRALQLTIVDADGEPNESYTGIADDGLLDPGVRPGVMVGATFKACVGPSVSTWLITEIVPL
jgi:hypothetical protein